MGRALVALLTGLIDYAGLFPPAALSMPDAVARYARYRRAPHAWMLGRFILSREALPAFEQHAAPWLTSDQASDAGPWRLSVLATNDLAADIAAITAFNTRHPGSIDAIEAKATSADDVRRIVTAFAPLRLWVETSPGPAFDATLGAIAAAGPHVGAKMRTGGTTPDAIPAVETVAAFLQACARAGVACKATAGLHHPLRAVQRLTYADDSPTGLMHGFVNVFLAAALARAGASLDTLVALLEERDARQIVWRDGDVSWRTYTIDVATLAASRAEFARSFGSCSFEEPVEDLERLGWR